jgi:drug/metabolite transporter (DMT)-like permease
VRTGPRERRERVAIELAARAAAHHGWKVSSRDLGLVLLSALLHAGWNAAAKKHDKPTAFLSLIVGFTLLGTLLCAPLFPVIDVGGELGWLLLASCCLHGLSFVVLSRAYEAGDLSVVYPISRSTPAVVPLLAVPLLGEHVSTVGAVGIALTLVGMWLVQTGGALRTAALREPAALWAYLMLLLTAGFSLVDKRAMMLLSELPWSGPLPRALAYYLVQTSGAALIFLPFVLSRLGRAPLMGFVRGSVGIGLLAAVATLASYVLVLEALRTAQVSYVVAVRQCSVLFAVALAVLALSERPSRLRWAGTLGTVAGVVLIALHA